MRARTPPVYSVTVMLRVTEGPLRGREDFGTGALRVYLKELTFTRARLLALMKSRPADFPGVAKDPDGAIDDLRERIQVEISDGDFVAERRDTDPPRSARIMLSFTSSNPAAAWSITQALADLLIDSALARQRAALLREQAAAETAMESASDDTSFASPSVVSRLKAREGQAAAARFGLRAAEEHQALRFELVDPGRVPTAATKASLASGAIVTFAIALLAACVLVGAFDPRVIEPGDLVAAGVPLLGSFPPLPAPPDPAGPGPQKPEDAPPPPSDDRAPRV